MKYKKPLIIIIAIITILLTTSCYALTVGNPRPIITTEFNEPIILNSIDASLKDTLQNPIAIELIDTSQDNKTIKHQPLDYLDEGSYIFSIQAQDIYGNLGEVKTQPFTISVPPLSISLYQPPFQISQTNIFDIIIKTSLPCECRYALIEKEYSAMTNQLQTNQSIYHILSSFDITISETIYTACESTYNNETTQQSFTFTVDSTKPVITQISAQDIAEPPLETTINLQTDDLTVCAYSKLQTNFSDMTLFSESDPESQDTYKTSHSHLLTSDELQDFSVNTFYLICKNLAQLNSDTNTLEINVQSQAEPTIEINSPKSDTFYSQASIAFNLSTNKLAECYFANNNENITGAGGTFGTSTKSHLSNPLNLASGEHTYYFRCKFDEPYLWQTPISTTFTIDNTNPIMEYLQEYHELDSSMNLTEFTSHTDRISIKWNAYDNQSGIEEYNYSIFKKTITGQDEMIKNWTTIDDEQQGEEQATITGLELQDKTTYYFKIKAKNKAGAWSTEYKSDGITVDKSLTVYTHCGNGIMDSGETDIDCGDVCPSCLIGKKCVIDTDCITGICNQQTKLCSETQITDTCANQIFDIGETDIDCGGTCPPCTSGKSCSYDSDCLSSNCNQQNICEEFTLCGNNQLNQGEQCDTTSDSDCSIFGLEQGILNCNQQCIFDTSSCLGPAGECGDEIINPGEQCDGENLGNLRGCFDINDYYQSGTIYCQNCELIIEQCSSTQDPLMDTDNNGMPDVCELKHFQTRTGTDPDADPDNDGLTNQQECQQCNGVGTNPHEADTDNDGYKDGKEVIKQTSPCDAQQHPSSPLMQILIIVMSALLAISGILYFLYYKKAITFTQQPPYIEWNPEIKSLEELFGKPKSTTILKPLEKQPSSKPTTPSKVSKPKGKTLQKKKPKKSKIKTSDLKRIMKHQKRKKILEAFENNKPSKKPAHTEIKKLKLRNK